MKAFTDKLTQARGICVETLEDEIEHQVWMIGCTINLLVMELISCQCGFFLCVCKHLCPSSLHAQHCFPAPPADLLETRPKVRNRANQVCAESTYLIHMLGFNPVINVLGDLCIASSLLDQESQFFAVLFTLSWVDTTVHIVDALHLLSRKCLHHVLIDDMVELLHLLLVLMEILCQLHKLLFQCDSHHD